VMCSHYRTFQGITFMFEVPPALAARFQNDPKSMSHAKLLLLLLLPHTTNTRECNHRKVYR